MGNEKSIDPAALEGLSREEMLERLSSAGVSISKKSAEDRLHEMEIKIAELQGSQLRIQKNSVLDWASDEYWRGTGRAMVHGWPVFVVVGFIFMLAIASVAR